MKVLVTGGAGYIGSHTCVEIIEAGHEILVYDNLSLGSKKALNSVELITQTQVPLVVGDILDEVKLNDVFRSFQPDAVIHFAGLKSVNESLENPSEYYRVNVVGSINLMDAMDQAGCKHFIFSSSATVYGSPIHLPINEDHPTNPTTPYGHSKLMVERMIKDWTHANAKSSAIVLRYFNPIGAHESGIIGEDPKGSPNNLMPILSDVATGLQSELLIYGDDYSTRDGTGERDYIHVSDLAFGHVLALQRSRNFSRFQILNLGTGAGTTVIELIKEFEKCNAVKIPTRIVGRRPGDQASVYADATLASKSMGFTCKRSIREMCQDTWRWKKSNSNLTR